MDRYKIIGFTDIPEVFRGRLLTVCEPMGLKKDGSIKNGASEEEAKKIESTINGGWHSVAYFPVSLKTVGD